MTPAAVRYGMALGCFALGLTAGLALDRLFEIDAGSRSAAPAAAAGMSTGVHGASGTRSSRSLEGVAQELALRLSISGGSDADWELLAKSYDALGRAEDAEGARRHEVRSGRGIDNAVAASAAMLSSAPVSGAAARAAAPPKETRGLIARAEDLRQKREFAAACREYEKVIASGGMDADAWADYADALGSRDGTLAPAAKSIARSLELDPRHTKALWLKASLEHEQRNYAASLETWQRLLALLPPDSSDSRVVKANVAETKQLLEANGTLQAGGRDG